MKRTRSLFFTLLAIVTIGLIAWYYLKPADFSELTTAEQLNTLEKKINDIYEEDGNDLSLRQFNRQQDTINEEIEILDGTVALTSEKNKLEDLKADWSLLTEMGYVKGALDERFNFRNGRLKSEEDLPEDFEDRLNALEEPKPVFYNKYSDYYDQYQEALEEAQEDSDDSSEEISSSEDSSTSREDSSSRRNETTSTRRPPATSTRRPAASTRRPRPESTTRPAQSTTRPPRESSTKAPESSATTPETTQPQPESTQPQPAETTAPPTPATPPEESGNQPDPEPTPPAENDSGSAE